MKLFRLTLAAAVAATMLTATAGFACEGHAKKTSEVAKAGGCGSKAKVVNASQASGCAKDKASMEACAKAMKAKGSACCAKNASQVASAEECTLRPGKVALKGTVLCNHCDLQKGEGCSTVIQTAKGCVYPVTGENVASLREEGLHSVVRLRGSVADDGALTVDTFRVVRAAETERASL